MESLSTPCRSADGSLLRSERRTRPISMRTTRIHIHRYSMAGLNNPTIYYENLLQQESGNSFIAVTSMVELIYNNTRLFSTGVRNCTTTPTPIPYTGQIGPFKNPRFTNFPASQLHMQLPYTIPEIHIQKMIMQNNKTLSNILSPFYYMIIGSKDILPRIIILINFIIRDSFLFLNKHLFISVKLLLHVIQI